MCRNGSYGDATASNVTDSNSNTLDSSSTGNDGITHHHTWHTPAAVLDSEADEKKSVSLSCGRQDRKFYTFCSITYCSVKPLVLLNVFLQVWLPTFL